MRLLRRRQPEPEPADRSEEWAGLLRNYRTTSSRRMQLDLYHREARQRRQAESWPWRATFSG